MAQQVVKNEFAVRRKQAIKEGLKEGMLKSAKGLLKCKVDDNIIISSTGISKKELEKIKKEMKEDIK